MKKIFIISLVLLFSFSALGIFLSPTLAKNDKNLGKDQIIPEEDGIYEVAGHPEMKVRVFVHKVKPAPTPTPTPELACQLTDPSSNAFIEATGWKLPDTYTYNLNPNSVPILIDAADWPAIVQNSFGTWTDETVGKVAIARGSDTDVSRYSLDGTNLVAWGRASATTLGVTYIWYYSTGEVVEIDTIMNKKFVWEWSGGATNCAYTDSYDAQNILTHEIGHWFGLKDHYTAGYEDNTMFGYGSKKETKKNTLTKGDIAGILAIYQ